MSDDYLFDGSGPPDAEVQRLERLLAPLRLTRPAPDLTATRPAPHRRRYYLAAATLALLAVGAWWWHASTAPRLTVAGGTVRIDGQSVDDSERPGIGQWIETADASQATLEIPQICSADLAANTRLRMQVVKPDRCVLELTRGRVVLNVHTPAEVFEVQTPAARIVDLGCQFEVDVGEAGITRVKVVTGRVEVISGNRRALLYFDWRCTADPALGVGTPLHTAAPAALVEAVANYDWKGRTPAGLDRFLAAVGATDRLTLWGLFRNADATQRRAIFERISALLPLPPGLSAEAAITGDPKALRELQDALTSGW